MEKESFFSGYCRTIDNSRMVAVETEEAKLIEVDCSFESCPFTGECVIAKGIRELLGE